MITKVHARNYRSLGDVEVELGPLTVLVGPNGSGKSNFVDVLHFLTDAFRHSLDAAILADSSFWGNWSCVACCTLPGGEDVGEG